MPADHARSSDKWPKEQLIPHCEHLRKPGEEAVCPSRFRYEARPHRGPPPYQAKDGSWWLILGLLLGRGRHGADDCRAVRIQRTIRGGRTQPPGRYWREIGGGAKPSWPGKGFDLAKYEAARNPSRPAMTNTPRTRRGSSPRRKPLSTRREISSKSLTEYECPRQLQWSRL